jgi:DUF4097 and DUF4098 domain-containing protein YvlB
MPEYTFDTPEPVELYVENGTGRITVAAEDVARTEVRVQGSNADQVEVVHDGAQVRVVAPKTRGFFGDQKLEMDVVVPTDSRLAVKSGSADIRVTGRVATATIKCGSGEVSLDRVAGAGSIDTGSGDVTLAEAGGDLRVRTGSGDVVATRLGADATISSGSGDIRVEHAAGPVVVKTGSGDLEIGHAASDVMMKTGSGDTVIRRATRGKITSKGASGDVRIGVPSGTPVWTDISTVTGNVRSGLEGVGEPEPGADHIEVRATTVSGDVHLLPA